MNNTQNRVFEYLTNGEGSTYERKRVLQCLVHEGVLTGGKTESETKEALLEYLEHNPTGACSEGQARFKEALGLAPRPTQTMQIVVNIEIHDTEEEPLLYGGGRQTIPNSVSRNASGMHTGDCGMVGRVLDAIRSQPWAKAVAYEQYRMNVAPHGNFPSTRIPGS